MITPNIIVNSAPWTQQDIDTLFEDEKVYFTDVVELSVLMRDLGIYKSANVARRSGRSGPIPSGWTEFKASKKVTLWIWNPTE